ncbi:MAG: hypothetical protein KY460_11315 [Actinobacteria bacterium]|nr:hypothetical protein [Actinomycetota bacterium]
MLQHLVDNAVTFTERGGVDVSVELVERTGDICTIRIAVHDTGVGLDPETQRRLVAPVDPTDAPWAGGHPVSVWRSVSRSSAGWVGRCMWFLSPARHHDLPHRRSPRRRPRDGA